MSTETKTQLLGSYLYGYVPGQERVMIKNTAEQIAAFIMAHRCKGQLKIVNYLDVLELQTMGEFIDYCENKHFLQNQLLPVLIPMQRGETEVVEFVAYVDPNYTLKNVRGINEDGKYVLVDVEFFDYTEQTLVNDEVFDTEEELIAKYPNSVGEEYAGWYINASPYEREEFIEEYVDGECDADNIKDLLFVSDEVAEKYLQEENYEDFKVAVAEKMNAMSNDELNQFAFKHDIWNRVKTTQPLSKFERGNRYEFINAYIGWLSTEDSDKEILDISDEEYEKLLNHPDEEEIDNKISEKLASYTNEQLNAFSKQQGYDFIIED